MTDITVNEARERFDSVLTAAVRDHARVRIVEHGNTVAAVISVEDLELLEALEDAADLAAVEEALADPENADGPIPWKTAKQELGL